ncbi:MAG: hypothetical protein GF344_00345, partial [Chitinivibrionales bacterium]|nr:hypothetical protein [Chitinivibrionales bacterium]MBD3355576.1 hypothetical protein [Chitinivibrionales bacterium]
KTLVGELPPNFFASLRLLEQEGKASVLARPSLTVLNGNRASIEVDQTEYVKLEGGTEENRTSRLHPIAYGINLSITPWISSTGQITADIRPVISNAVGVNNSEDQLPSVFKRAVNTTVCLSDGQTVILGGLLRKDHVDESKKVPILGDIPIVGALFRTLKQRQVETNLVLFITPRIVDPHNKIDIQRELARIEEDCNLYGGNPINNAKELFSSPRFSTEPYLGTNPEDTTSSDLDSAQIKIDEYRSETPDSLSLPPTRE